MGSPTARLRENDQPPSRRKIPIALRHRPDRMEMIGQYDDRIDRKWMALAGLAKRKAQGFNVFRQQPQPAVGKIDRKEEAPAGDEIATVFSHGPPAWRSDGFRFALPILRQLIDVLCQQSEMPLLQINGEEEASSCDEVATIIGHGDLLVR
jgi:hypothetical protein